MEEISDARACIKEINPGRDRLARWAWWAPGDCTRYHVTYLNAAAHTPDRFAPAFHALLVQVGVAGSFPDGLIVPRPHADYLNYDPSRWLGLFGDGYGGWWGGVRPLLAALGWATPDCSALAYDPADADAIYRRRVQVQDADDDTAILASPQLQDSLAQMRRGEVTEA